jgi:NAD(P)-dependent dehydrogenase (short-subunit alcohol dehydrogenase family)
VTGARAELIGRRSGKDIVQIGHAEGVPARWVFSEIMPDSFRWASIGLLEEQEPDGLDQMVQLNVAALTTLTRLALPGMRQRRWGRILNVASVVGHQPGAARMAAYYATKAYVLSFSKGLWGAGGQRGQRHRAVPGDRRRRPLTNAQGPPKAPFTTGCRR